MPLFIPVAAAIVSALLYIIFKKKMFLTDTQSFERLCGIIGAALQKVAMNQKNKD